MKDIMDLIGRIIIGFIFILEAIHSIVYFDVISSNFEEFGIERLDNIFLIFIIGLLLLGGTLIILGYRVFFGGLIILLYWIPMVLIEHSFWNDDEPQRRIESLIFIRSLAVAAGVLIIMAHGSGKYSVRRLFANTKIPKRFR